jgi:drug/metabolite transporter (DMT)-like permease
MTLSTVFFSINDATMKLIAADMPMLQAMTIRGAIVSLGLAAIAYASGALIHWTSLVNPVVAVRSTVETIGSFAFMLALPNIPLASAIALNMATPLYMLPMAAIVLGERYGWRRVAAILVGFSGVLLILQPTPAGVDPWLLLSFASSLFFAMRDVATRRISREIPTTLIALAMALAVTICTGAVTFVQGWVPVDARQLALLALAAVMVGFGYTLVVKAMRQGEVSLTGAFRYAALFWATLFGWFLWGEVPNTVAWFGIALILGAGLYALHRERVRSRGR